MNLEGFFLLANFAEQIHEDLWHYQSPSGASLAKAYAYLKPYLNHEKPWLFPQIVPFHDQVAEFIKQLSNKL